MLFMAITVRAQLIFSNGKKVAVGTDTVVFEPSVPSDSLLNISNIS